MANQDHNEQGVRFERALGDVMQADAAPLDMLSPVERQTSIDAILAASAGPAEGAPGAPSEVIWWRQPRAVLAAAAVVLATLAAIAIAASTSEQEVKSVREVAHSVTPERVPSVAPKTAGLRRGAQEPTRKKVWRGGVAEVDSTQATIEEGGSLRLAERSAGVLRFSLERGTARFVVDPKREQRVSIYTPHAVVAVVGTVFTVTVTEGNTRVEVERGKVGFHPHRMKGIHLEKGQHANSSSGIWVPLESHAFELQKQRFEELDAKLKGGSSDHASKRDGEVERVEPDSEQRALAPERGVKGAEDAARPSARELLSKAREARAAQDWEESVRLYKALVKYHPKDPAAPSAMISLSRLSLDKLDDPKSASYWASRYLKETSGDAPFRRDARALHARALEVSGTQ